jgi:hypothetical protein
MLRLFIKEKFAFTYSFVCYIIILVSALEHIWKITNDYLNYVMKNLTYYSDLTLP